MIKKRLFTIGIFLLVGVVVAVAIVLVSGIEPAPETPEENLDFGLTVNDEGIRVYRFSPVNVDYMEIENRHETYQVRMDGNTVYIVGYETIPLLSASASGLFRSVETLTLKTVVDPDCADLSRFGLEDPQATITIQAYSGASVTFYIGDASPTGEYYYMSVKGESAVYLMEGMFAERYLKSVTEYCDKKIYKTFVPYEDFVALSVKSPTVNYSFRIATEEEKAESEVYFSGIAMEQPFAWGADSVSIETVMDTMVELTADTVQAVCVKEEDLGQYGLDAASRTEIVLTVYADPNPTMYNDKANPYFDSSKPSGTYQEFPVTYWIGGRVDNSVYVMFEGRPVVYTIPADTFSWLEWRPYRYAIKMLFGEYIYNVKTLTVKTPEDAWVFSLSGAESSDKSDFRVFCGDRSIDGDNFRNFYGTLMGLYPSGEGVMPEQAGDPVLEIVYDLTDGSQNVIAFYPMDDRNCAANVDGQTFLSVRVTEVQKVLSDVQKLLAGQTVLS